jgi:hypothetical protein
MVRSFPSQPAFCSRFFVRTARAVRPLLPQTPSGMKNHNLSDNYSSGPERPCWPFDERFETLPGEIAGGDRQENNADLPFPEGFIACPSENNAMSARVDGLKMRWRWGGGKRLIRPGAWSGRPTVRASGACHGLCLWWGHFCQHRWSPFTRLSSCLRTCTCARAQLSQSIDAPPGRTCQAFSGNFLRRLSRLVGNST